MWMKKGLLILACILVTVVFSSYILDLKVKSMHVSPDYTEEAQGDTEEITAFIAGAERQDAPQAAGGGWELIWEDEFDTPYLDLEAWTEADRKDNYNHELQYYTPANAYLADGCLYLTAKKEKKEDKNYTSAMVQTIYKLSFCYGKIEARIKLPAGKGLLPAFWLLSYPGDSEVEVMEMMGSEPTVIYGVNHSLKGGAVYNTYGTIKNETPEDFHAYVLEWEPGELRWYFDDVLFYQTSEKVPSENMYILLTLAVGGDWPGDPDESTPFPCSMAVDYVRLYRYAQETARVPD
jgi:beta-glucanase (GH16 family)